MVVHPESDNPARFARGSSLVSDEGVDYRVDSSTRSQSGLLVRFAGVDDRTAAERLRGHTLWIEPSQRRALADDEFWPDELVGAEVVSTDGRRLGVVEAVIEGAAQDRLVVSGAKGRFEVPFVSDLVVAVDVEEGVVTIDAIEGLVIEP